MNENIFRKKIVDKMNSPEDLNRYLRVTNPPTYVALLAVVLLLVGAIIWSITGHIETAVSGSAVCKDGECVVYLSGEYAERLPEKLVVRIGKAEYEAEPAADPENPSSVVLRADCGLPDGEYDAQLILESISPWSFLLNSAN